MQSTTLLNDWMLEKLQNGDCILFLGAGASFGATGPNGEKPLTGNQLRDLVCDKFLGGKHKDKALTRVAEFAKYKSSLPDVQEYIRNLFLPLEPAAFHELIPLFRWHAIVTTNYDLIIERAYDRVPKRLQKLRPIIRDGDNFSAVLKDQDSLPYLKLHGCINTINDERLPLILGSEEYAKYKNNRTRLFNHFADWGRERPIIFAGYDISDPNIQQILFDLTDLGVARPAYAVIDPGLDEIACGYWQGHRFETASITFAEFMKALDAKISSANRVLASLRSVGSLSVSPWFKSTLPPSQNLTRYLAEELEHVHPANHFAGVDPKAFYAGSSVGWAAFEQGLDLKRSISDDLILSLVLTEGDPKAPAQYLVKGHAGSGKTVALKRFAWDAGKDFQGRVVFLQEGGVVRSGLLVELAELTQAPIVVVIDDALRHANDVNRLYKESASRGLPIRILLGARHNEWNIAGGEFDWPFKEEFELKDLKPREVDGLLSKLKEHGALGELAKFSHDEQVAHFNLHADRQLMVALHEATTGRTFEEIALDEYLNVRPQEAQILYLDICTLHRLGVPVRAGLVSRVSGVSFETFSREFFKPLEHVVKSYFDSSCRDYVYKSRHPLIAEFVFGQALPNPDDRAAQICRIIRHMDTDYESDSYAFDRLIRGRLLANLFENKLLVKNIFDAALESGAAADYVNHQMAVFELHHVHGSMRNAADAINEAEKISEGKDRSILHTKAMVLRRLALESTHQLEKSKLRADAKLILRKLQDTAKASHPHDTYGRLLLDELKDKLNEFSQEDKADTDLTSRSISDLIRGVEELVSVGLQKFPGDDHLLTLDADLAKLLYDEPRALVSLEAAVASNPGRPYIAVRLANAYGKRGELDRAQQVLRACLQQNPSSKECHLELAHLLRALGEFQNRQDIAYHLKRSFTEGDANFEAQFWCARHELLYGDPDKGESIFKRLSGARVSSNYRNNPRGFLLDKEGRHQRLSGSVKTVGYSFCFATSPELRFDVHIRPAAMDPAKWQYVEQGARVSFELAFTLKGPIGLVADMS